MHNEIHIGPDMQVAFLEGSLHGDRKGCIGLFAAEDTIIIVIIAAV